MAMAFVFRARNSVCRARTLITCGLLFGASLARADERPAARTEAGVLPIVGGDSDFGFGGGGLVSLSRIEPDYVPYRWYAELGAIVTFKGSSQGVSMPYEDVYVRLDVPRFISDRIRLELRPSFTRELNQLYYGIGNASVAPQRGPGGEPANEYFQYQRVHPTLSLRLLLRLTRTLYLQLGNLLTYNAVHVYQGSKLDLDRSSSDPRLRSFFGPLGPHLVDFFEYSLIYDTRDNEVAPTHGGYHHLRLRLSPGGSSPLPYRYGQMNITARVYTTVIRRYWTLALRIVCDVLFGDPPFYELTRFEDTTAFGGVRGVRGVPGGRYYGKIKLFGNVESRSQLAAFTLFGLPCTLSGVLFVDAGRLWSDLHADPKLDGDGLGMKLGLGGGLRLQQGVAFVVRGDIAWSPDARPIGAYLTAGQTF